MKEEKKQSMKADSPHRIVNIHRSNMSSKEALEVRSIRRERQSIGEERGFPGKADWKRV